MPSIRVLVCLMLRQRATGGSEWRAAIDMEAPLLPPHHVHAMQISTLTELFAQELTDLQRAEQQTLSALGAVFEAATSPELQDALATHREECKEHSSRLALIIADYPRTSAARESEALAGLLAEAEEAVEQETDELLKDLGLIAACQRIKHYKIATYGSVRNYARRLGDDNAVELLTLTIEEEEGADLILTNIAEGVLDEVDDNLAAIA